MLSSVSNPSPPLGKCPLGYQHGVPWISINSTGWARVFPSTLAYEMFSYWLRANLCWWVFSAINQFSWTDRIKQRHKYISRQDRRVCTPVALCSLLLSADRKINGIFEPIVFLASFQLFLFGWGYFSHTVSTPVFLFNKFQWQTAIPSPSNKWSLPWGQLSWSHLHSLLLLW